MLNVVGYVRLSRDENKENYASIQAQKEIIENYANTHKLKISKFFEDDDVSGYKRQTTTKSKLTWYVFCTYLSYRFQDNSTISLPCFLFIL